MSDHALGVLLYCIRLLREEMVLRSLGSLD